MPKTITATDTAIESLAIQIDETGAVTGLTAVVNVSYDEAKVREQFDLWTELTASQRTAFQALHDRLTQRLQATYLG